VTDQGDRWRSATQALRTSKKRQFTLSPAVNARLDQEAAQKRNISAAADAALRAYYGMPSFDDEPESGV
jgi:hypothetical protein